MGKEYTTEESDKILLQEMWLAETDSTINSEEEEAEENADTQDDEAFEDIQEDSDDSDYSQEEWEEEDEEEEKKVNTSKKPKKWIAKVLHQRNEARQEAEQAKSQVQELQAKLEKLEADWNYWNEEYIQTLVDKRLAEADEKQEFFETNEELKIYKKDILSYSRETWLPLDKASKLYLAENAPELLLDTQQRNKQKSKMYWVPAVTSKKLVSWKYNYTEAEFEEMAKKGLIQF